MLLLLLLLWIDNVKSEGKKNDQQLPDWVLVSPTALCVSGMNLLSLQVYHKKRAEKEKKEAKKKREKLEQSHKLSKMLERYHPIAPATTPSPSESICPILPTPDVSWFQS